MAITNFDKSPSKIKDDLVTFLKTFGDESGPYKYRKSVSQLGIEKNRSVVVEFSDLASYSVEFAFLLQTEPKEVLPIFEAAAAEVASIENPSFLAVQAQPNRVPVRIRNVGERMSLRGLDASRLGKLFTVGGIVLRASERKVLIREAAFRCKAMNHLNHVVQDYARGPRAKPPFVCDHCESKTFDLDERKSMFSDFQTLTLQEMPEDLPAGQIPRGFDLVFSEDLVNACRPGDRVAVTAIPEVERSGGKESPLVLPVRLLGNFVEALTKNVEDSYISQEEEKHFKSFAALPGSFDRLVNTFCPKIYSQEYVKEAVLLQLAGCPQTTLSDGSTLRGDLSVLLLGDPGTGKSEIAKFAHRVAPRGVYTVGRGSTAAGLSAAVVKDKDGTFTLEAGAAVLSDLGLLVIDEFGDLRLEDMSALKEIMEQQTVSVAKASITANLNARTSILANMNPVDGKYDFYKNIVENIGVVPIALLTRFDLIFIMRDEMNEENEQALTEHIGYLRKNLALPPASQRLEFDFLKRYLLFTKRIHPRLTDEAYNVVAEFYKKLRRESEPTGLSVTPRWLEGLTRLTIARARLMLRDKTTEEDAHGAITLVQRMLRATAIDPNTKKVDIGILHNKPLSEKGMRETALQVFKELSGETKQPVDNESFVRAMESRGCSRDQAAKLFETLWKTGITYEFRPGLFKKM